jgi:TetR/AcrR family transcriptional repressor of lmrAB and yxaGH operons
MASDSRERMIQSAALLMRERGVEATSLSDVLEHSGAPRGSVYHHFPDGKAQLVEEATRYAGDFIAAALATALAQDDPVTALRGFTDTWLAVLRDSEYAAGCPVVAAAVEGDGNPAAREAAGVAFQSWQASLADAIERHGIPSARAERLATLAIASIEGAVVLSRAQRSTAPLERVADELVMLTRDALEEAQRA